MKDRPIKFRGSDMNGHYIFGDVVQWGGFQKVRVCSWDNGVIYDVAPDSVTQLIGTDKNNREVYEGDRVFSHGEYYKVKLLPVFINEDDDSDVVINLTDFKLEG